MPLDLTKSEIQTLISSLNKRKAFVIAGAGVSSASIDSDSRKIFGTWTNLLRYGITFCCDKCITDENWGSSCFAFLNNEHATTEDLLKIGDKIWDCLEAHGKVQEWLDIFDNALLENRELIIPIKALGIPIATANYDNLLEDIMHLTPITLQETQKVEDFIKNDQERKYILHLHGYYKKPDSIVLGQKSYDRIVQNEFAQFINKYLITAHDAVIFVGFGQGVYDQNFSLIFQWVSKYLSKTKLYHIVLDKYVDETKEMHKNNGNPNVVVLGYGENYDELTPFINALAHNIEHDDDLPKTLEGKPECIGQNRLDLVEEVAQYLSKNYTKPAGILGTGGLGKTNLVLNILHHKSIDQKYRRNRFFIRCDGAKDLSLFQNMLVNALEMPVSSGDLGDRILNYLTYQDNRFLIALDNFETTWEDKDNIELFIEKLKDHADLIFTYRGNNSPDELDWNSFKVPFLKEQDAITLFNEKSGKKFGDNTLVKTVVQEVDYLPLAIDLLAKRAKKVENLEDFYKEWQKKSNEFISKGGQKNDNLNLSISFSYDNTRLTETNRAFLQALGFLPLGMNRKDLETIIADAYDQIEILKELGLCEETEQSRIWVLAPIREYLTKKNFEDNQFLDKIQNFYLELALNKGQDVGKKEDNGSSLILRDEWNNVIKAIDSTLDTQKSIHALCNITDYCKFSGIYPTVLLEKAINIAKTNKWENEEANCLRFSGDFEFKQLKIESAKKYNLLALSLYKKINHVSGNAHCCYNLGNLAFHESKIDEASEYYQKSLILYEQVEDVVGQANCLRSFGEISYRMFKNGIAYNHYQQALILFRDRNDYLGEANCLYNLGDLALFRQSDYKMASFYYKESLELQEKVGSLTGKANCLCSLGEVAYRELGKDDIAHEYYNQALTLFEHGKIFMGVANCFRCFGNLAFRQNDSEKGNKFYQDAMTIYEDSNALYTIGWTYKLWSDWVNEPTKREYRCKAKKVLISAKLYDCIRNWNLTDLVCE